MNVYALLDSEMVRLELEADNSSPDDLSAFTTAYETIDWDSRPAGDFVQAIKLALRAGAHLIAREAALTGISHFPDNPELQEMAQVLAPPQAYVIKSKNQDARRANHRWLQAHRKQYNGRWVALESGELLAAADSPADLIAKMNQKRTSGVLLTQVW